eukprot:CAMPEP_0119071200 /NCGR_PEP_ID=MMETSP1178-20130426/48513_1 /TAXON_ID=33656 /ORGANISM="unid sp, Strain CCMP2000" /LENGTH=177 /DNA_ID=CAMNT_0007053105 /DNA_START=20 /DNA_END=553 /DNA_ORIENTATION=-
MSGGPPELVKKRSSARIAATTPFEYFKKRKSSTDGLTGAMSGLETGGDGGGAGEAQQKTKVRKASVVGDKSAFAKFQAAANAPPPKSAKEELKKAKFDAKKDKFESGAAFEQPKRKGSTVGGVKGALKAFETKAKEKAAQEPVRTKTWAVGSGAGNYKPKYKIGDGPAPKKGFADLP